MQVSNKLKRDKRVQQAVDAMKKKSTPQPKRKLLGLSSGSSMVNLHANSNPYVCYLAGHFYYFVGDSGSGKTWLAISALAEASINPQFDKYQLIFDNGENGALMNLREYFGDKLVKRIKAPKYVDGKPVFSSTVQELTDNIDSVAQNGPFVYVQDSFDILEDESDIELFNENKKQRESGKNISQSYGTQKARSASTSFRRILRLVRKTNSILIIISQTRDKVGALPFQKTKTRAGGRSLTFYNSLELWTSVIGKIEKTLNGKKRVIGKMIKVQLEKNRLNGESCSVEIPIRMKLGIDDTQSMIDYLIDEKHWKNSSGNIKTPEFGNKSWKVDGLIRYIEASPERQDKLKQICQTVWDDVQSKINNMEGRAKRYG